LSTKRDSVDAVDCYPQPRRLWSIGLWIWEPRPASFAFNNFNGRCLAIMGGSRWDFGAHGRQMGDTPRRPSAAHLEDPEGAIELITLFHRSITLNQCQMVLRIHTASRSV